MADLVQCESEEVVVVAVDAVVESAVVVVFGICLKVGRLEDWAGMIVHYYYSASSQLSILPGDIKHLIYSSFYPIPD